MTLRPLGDRVVVKMTEVEETTRSGILLTASAKEKPEIAVVVAVGPGGMVDGKEVTWSSMWGIKWLPASMQAHRLSAMVRNIPL